MKIILQIYSLLVGVIALPFAYFARIPIHPWHYYYCAIFASQIPFLFGDVFRQWFYRVCLSGFGGGSRVMFGAVIQTRDCSLGAHVFVGNYSLISHTSVGDDTMIGPSVHVISGGRSHGIDDIATPMRLQKGVDTYIHIGSDVWVGSNSCIMADIATGSVVGAGSVVTKTFREYDVIAGNPAKVLKNRKNI